MKRLLIVAAAATCLLSGCNRTPARSRPVKETYIHKYGLCVSKEEWQSHGSSGKVVNILKDGVTVTANYQRGDLNGETTYSFPNSDVIACVELYQDGRLVSETENYGSGTPKLTTCFGVEGGRELRSWYEDGTPRCRERYQGDRLIAAEYFTPQNVLESRFDQGKGIRIVRDEYGHLESEDQIQEGLLVMKRTFHLNGDPRDEVPFLNGQVHGTRRTFLVGGVPHSVEEWKLGYQDGLTMTFQSGQKHAEIQYRFGQKHGPEHRFGPVGEVAEQLTWVNGKEHGAHRYLLGDDEKVDWYHKGQIVSKTTFEKLNFS